MPPDSVRGVRIRAPATSANLGPGFDSLALALAWYDEVEVRVVDGRPGGPDVGVSLVVTGCGAESSADPANNLVVQTVLATLAELDAVPGGLDVRCTNTIPQGRGLGSSAAAIAAGVSAARALADGRPSLDRARVIDQAARREGHADNVAACVLGGLTIAWNDDAHWRAVRLDPLGTLAPVVLVPSHELQTTAARAVLPPTVPHADAAANAGRAALLVAALTSDIDLLYAASEDWLHQPYRASVLPDTIELVRRLRSRGLPAVMSGAGPSVLVLHDPHGQSARDAPPAWEVRAVAVDGGGLTIDTADDQR